jgi:ubiquinol oxidase
VLDIAQPTLFERLLVLGAQGSFFILYMIFYILSPRVAHRFVGYLEEEAIVSYTSYLEEIDAGVGDHLSR